MACPQATCQHCLACLPCALTYELCDRTRCGLLVEGSALAHSLWPLFGAGRRTQRLTKQVRAVWASGRHELVDSGVTRRRPSPDAIFVTAAHPLSRRQQPEPYIPWWPASIDSPTLYYQLKRRAQAHQFREQARSGFRCGSGGDVIIYCGFAGWLRLPPQSALPAEPCSRFGRA